MTFQVVIGIPALLIVPQVFFDPFLTGIRQRFVLVCHRVISCSFAGAGEDFFHFKHQAVQIDRYDAGGA
ncbi:Uncharacterised protein [Shigella flexneri]|nr:Uncharacterised protein [Shigella flexneri]